MLLRKYKKAQYHFERIMQNSMKFVDVHIHLSEPDYSQKLDDIIDTAKRSNVVALVSNSMDLHTSIPSIQLSKNYSGFVYSAIGIHPWSAGHLEPNEIQKTVRLISHPKEQDGKIVAIGEIGLDYKYSKTKESQDLQHKVFHEMLRAAEK